MGGGLPDLLQYKPKVPWYGVTIHVLAVTCLSAVAKAALPVRPALVGVVDIAIVNLLVLEPWVLGVRFALEFGPCAQFAVAH